MFPCRPGSPQPQQRVQLLSGQELHSPYTYSNHYAVWLAAVPAVQPALSVALSAAQCQSHNLQLLVDNLVSMGAIYAGMFGSLTQEASLPFQKIPRVSPLVVEPRSKFSSR